MIFKFGVVSAVNPFKVRYDGESVVSEYSPKRLGSYTPNLGDRVIVIKIKSVYLCLGKVV